MARTAFQRDAFQHAPPPGLSAFQIAPEQVFVFIPISLESEKAERVSLFEEVKEQVGVSSKATEKVVLI